MSNSLLVARMSVNSLVLVVFDVNGKNELIIGIVVRKLSSDLVAVAVVVVVVAAAVDDCFLAFGSSNVRICKSCCNFEIRFKIMRLKRSICGLPPFLISSTGKNR